LERLIGHMMRQPGVRFLPLEEVVKDFRGRFPAP
ncbi:MAG: hypothetical protein JWR00_3478, partial [Rubritepida sp.]|nr:hypothetical protein [Rubritepida sp.]